MMLSVAASALAADEVAKQKAEDDIQEAVFRYMFMHHKASAERLGVKAYYLSLGENEADPSDEFMKRFADNKPPVKKQSEAQADAATGVKDRSTGERGYVLRIEKIKWVNDTEVEAEGGYYSSGVSASGNTYYLKKQDGRWIVAKDVMHWIS